MKLFTNLCYTIALLGLVACSNSNSEGTDENGKSNVKENLPPVLSFYDAITPDQGKTFTDIVEVSSFTIAQEGEDYMAIWADPSSITKEKIQWVKNLEDGKKYEFLGKSDAGEITYTLTKVNGEGIWMLTNSENEYKGYICDANAVALYEKEEETEEVTSTDSPKDMIAALGGISWIQLTEQEGGFVIFNECMYGSGGLAFDEDGKWIEFSGGGDAATSDIIGIEKKGDDTFVFKIKNDMGDEELSYTIMQAGGGMIIVDPGGDFERTYISTNKANTVSTVNEECDEEGM